MSTVNRSLGKFIKVSPKKLSFPRMLKLSILTEAFGKFLKKFNPMLLSKFKVARRCVFADFFITSTILPLNKNGAISRNKMITPKLIAEIFKTFFMADILLSKVQK
jgi:hypothetical protein